MSATTIEILTTATTTATGAGAVREPSFAALAAYALRGSIGTEATLDRARTVLLAALADLFLALNQAEAVRAVRALLPGNIQPGGARVPGTSYELEPRAAATAIGTLASWCTEEPVRGPLRACPLGAVLAVADFSDRKRTWRGVPPLTVRELLAVLIKAEHVRRALEQSSAHVMSEQHCLLGATTVATLSLLSQDAVQIGEALHRVWQAAGTPIQPAASLPAEAVRRAFDEPRLEAATGNPVACDVFQVQDIPGSAGHERRAVVQRFEAAVQTRLPPKQCERIKAIVADSGMLDGMAVNAFMAELVANQA